ncbi:MAG: helix-turn-helix domain-containing protein [Planctomycetota bacterium]|nr:helix-turn-helix domain-containing protein [Planctomycetota bacterium]
MDTDVDGDHAAMPANGAGAEVALDGARWGFVPGGEIAHLDEVDCPAMAFMGILGGKWVMPILYRLDVDRVVRSGDLERAIPGITRKELTKRLRQLERLGLVQRTVHAEVPPRVDYSLTAEAGRVLPAVRELSRWAEGNGERIREMLASWDRA